MFGMLGKKLGMTQIFNEHGDLVPVTVLEVGPCTVVQVRTPEKDGYWALQLGFEETKASRLNKAKRGHLAKNKAGMLRKLKEFRVEGDTGLKAGDVLRANFFEAGDIVSVSGTTKGRGFQGVVKRHGMSRGPTTHGGDCTRRPGSTGMRTDPHRVIKNKRMPGHMGFVNITTDGLRVEMVRPEDNVILVKGAVPGTRGGYLRIRCSGATYSNRVSKLSSSEAKGDENILNAGEKADQSVDNNKE